MPTSAFPGSRAPEPGPRVALVTGASSGIGLAVARALSRQGEHIVLTARSEDRLEAAAADLPGPSTVVPADVSEAGAAARLIDAVLAEHGHLDLLVANAGICLQGNV